ncbi:hypothetical protein Hdeb2414_s0003g00114851 [Helianthus debilis subsp. tardiflorus]
MFEESYGSKSEAHVLQLLAVGEVPGPVLDSWAHVVNYNSRYQLQGAARQLLCLYTTVVSFACASFSCACSCFCFIIVLAFQFTFLFFFCFFVLYHQVEWTFVKERVLR